MKFFDIELQDSSTQIFNTLQHNLGWNDMMKSSFVKILEKTD